MAILGHGADHDKTLASYQSCEQTNPKHVRVVSFDSVTNPQDVANDLIVLAGLNGK